MENDLRKRPIFLHKLLRQTCSLGSDNGVHRFMCGAFNADTTRFVAIDHLGILFHFSFANNFVRRVGPIGLSCTAVDFTLAAHDVVLVGCVDNSFRRYNIASTMVRQAVMTSHTAVIANISLDAHHQRAVTTSSNEAVLWDLETNRHVKKLVLSEDAGAILKAMFLPMSNGLITCLRNDTVLVWDAANFSLRCQLSSPDMHSKHYRCFAVSADGEYFLAGGKSRQLHVWHLRSGELDSILHLPEPAQGARRLHFLRPNQLIEPASSARSYSTTSSSSARGSEELLVAVLGTDRCLRIMQLRDGGRVLFTLGSTAGVKCEEPGINNLVATTLGDNFALLDTEGRFTIRSFSACLPTSNSSRSTSARSTSSGPRSIAPSSSSVRTEPVLPLPLNTKPVCALPKPLSLDRSTLANILKSNLYFPEKYRPVIWRSVMQLPENYEAFGALVDKGTHPAFELLEEKFPLKSVKLMRQMLRVLSALAHWSPLFGEVDYLPLFVFPFVKVFPNNPIHAFELVATILSNWCQQWFAVFPNPPIGVLAMVENALAYHDRDLHEHFIRTGVTTEVFAWPLLEAAFSTLFGDEEWARLWDTILCQRPGFLLLVPVAYALCSRAPLLAVQHVDAIEEFYRRSSTVPVTTLLKRTLQLDRNTPADLHPGHLLAPFTPLTSGQYPVLAGYPKFIVEYQIQERERIREEEKEILRQRNSAMELEQKIRIHAAEEGNWYRQQDLILKAEERRRKLNQEEDEKLREQRKRVAALSKQLKLQELSLLDASRAQMREHQVKAKQLELQRLEDEISRKMRQRNEESEIAVQAAEIRGMELALKQRMQENETMRRDIRGTSGTLRGSRPWTGADLPSQSRGNEEGFDKLFHEMDAMMNFTPDPTSLMQDTDNTKVSSTSMEKELEQLMHKLRTSQRLTDSLEDDE